MEDLTFNAVIQDQIDCKLVRDRIANRKYDSMEEGEALMLELNKCDLDFDNEKFPDQNKKAVVYMDNSGDEHRVLYGIIHVKDAENIAGYSKAILTMVAGKMALENPVKGFILDKAGQYSIDAWLESAKKEDRMLIIYPNYIPAKKKLREVIGHMSGSKPFNKMSTQVFDFVTDKIEDLLKAPDKLLLPKTKTLFELTGKVFKVTDYVREGATLIEKATDQVILPFTAPSLNVLRAIISNPTNLPAEIINQVPDIAAAPVKEVIRTAERIWRRRPRIKW